MSEHKSQQFYNHTYYAATYREVYSWLESWIAKNIFREDASRVFMASDGYAFRRRFELTDISRDFNSLPVAGLDLPFANYWPQNTGWKPDERVAAKNAVMIYDGVYEGTTKVKAAPVILSIPVTFYFGREDDARLAYDTLYLKTYNEHYYSTTVQYGRERLQLPIGMTLKNLSFNPKATEATWLQENRIFIISATFDMRTYALKTPKQSPWKRGGQSTEDMDPGFDKYTITEEVLLNTSNSEAEFFTATQYRFIEKDSGIIDPSYTLVEYETLDSGRVVFYLKGKEIPENSWRDQNFKKFFEQKNENDVYSGFPKSGNKDVIYVDAAAPERPIKWKWTDNDYVKISDSEVLADAFRVMSETTIELPWNVSVSTPEEDLRETSFKVLATISRESEDEVVGKYIYKTGVQDIKLSVNGKDVKLLRSNSDDLVTATAIIGEAAGKKDTVYVSEFEEPRIWDGEFKPLEEVGRFSTIKEGEDGSIIPDPSTIENPVLDGIYKFDRGEDNYYFIYYNKFGFATTLDKTAGQSIVEALRAGTYDGELEILDFEIVNNTNELPNSSSDELGLKNLNASTACALYQVYYEIPETYYVFGKGEKIYDFAVSGTTDGVEEPTEALAAKDLLYEQKDEEDQVVTYWWCDEVEEGLKWVKLYKAPTKDGEAYIRDFKKMAMTGYTELTPASVYNYIMTISFFKEKIIAETEEVVETIQVEEATKTIVNSIRTKGTIIKPGSSNDIENDPTPAVQHKDKLLKDSRVTNNKRLHPTENEQGWKAITGIEW